MNLSNETGAVVFEGGKIVLEAEDVILTSGTKIKQGTEFTIKKK